MSKKFVREDRYLVIKRKDIQNYLNTTDEKALFELADLVTDGRLLNKRGLLGCVVVEHDWPEYLVTWDLIEQRVLREGLKKVAIGLDGWKLPIFEAGLKKAGYLYDVLPGPTKESVFLKVYAETVEELAPVIQSLNDISVKSQRIH